MTTYRQDEDELLDYTFNWSPTLAAGETVATSTWTVPSGITAGITSQTATTTTQWLSGGTMGTEYTITNTILTTASRTYERSFGVLIISSSSEVVPSAPTGVTALQIITPALRLIGVLAAGETATGEEANDALLVLNDYIDELRTQRLSIYVTQRSVYPLTSGTASYRIGGGGAFDQQRPLWIPYARLIIDTAASVPTEIPIEVYSVQQYADVPQKSLSSGLVQCIYYDHNWTEGLGVIYPYPIPNVGNTSLVLYTPIAINEFTSLTHQVTFPPGYRKMLKYNLAVQLAAEYGREVAASVYKIATDSLATVKAANATQPGLLRVDAGLMGHSRSWNWRTGA
jgi:hypothetical protein